ncbi:LIM and calponin homology domains-containing protein 1-like isoform X4 [Plectropomus leopardus]|uniref:LIM and calponin homology domains-containing protein 1-like isoform X4 n=1 Tax=Plectropomus leopardus TaxID=160734 RepID=UPI001C4C95AD|nr:LIM and calponin homology domains-containing protein 1-like isoform X4 [Plectropomus leopardus]
MASPTAGRDIPEGSPRDEPELSGSNHPEPACLEAQKWIEAVTGKSFGDKDFRSGLENGILLCELLSAIKPGLVKKINRLPTPIAGLDNLSVFLRGCEELGLRGSQLFDPGDLQDTSIRANLKDSDCNRKLKNVLNTVFWLGKAASGCASYSGPTLNLKEFEGLLAQMKVESEEGGDGSQKRSVRDSGYDCWDSERSDSLSPPRHTRDNSLDSLDSFGSRSQHSPSPDVVNRGNSDGRGSDSEADAPNRRPDVRKDDMLARRTASSDSRSSIPFNQFLPNRTNASSYVPTPRRKPHTEEGEQRSQVDGADLNQTTPETPPTPAELDARLAQYERRSLEEEDEEEEDRIPDLRKDDMMARRTGVFHKQSSTTVTYNRFLPLPGTKRSTQGEVTTDAAPRNKREVQADRSKKLNVRVEQQPPRVPMETSQLHPEATIIRAHSEREYDDDEDEYDENEPVPDLEKDDMMARRTGSFQSAARTNQFIKQFLPVPGSVKYNVAPVSAMKPLHSRPKLTEKMANESSIVTVAAEPQTLPSKAPILRKCAGLRERQEETGKQDMLISSTSVINVTEPLSSPSHTPPLSPAHVQTCKVEAELKKQSVEERAEEKVDDNKKDVNEQPRKKPFWLDDDNLPPIMMSRRVAFMSEDTESVSMSDILNEEEVGHLPPLSLSRYERMHEQYNNFQEDEDHWQNDLAAWKNRRRSASQELIKKEEERKRMEKRMKEERSESNKRKSIKTYKEIVEEKERREAELCEAYRNAATPEEAAMVLQRYALRFTISDATLDSLKLPRSTSKPNYDLHKVDKEHKTTIPDNETSEFPHQPEPAVISDQSHTEPEEMETDPAAQQETSVSVSSSPPSPVSPLSPVTNSENVPPQPLELKEPQSKPTESPTTHQIQPITGDAKPQTKHTPPQTAQGQPQITQPVHTLPSPSSVSPRPVPLLAAKPYCQPRNTQTGHKAVKMDGLVRVNGETMEDLPASTPSAPEVRDVPSQPPETNVLLKQMEKDVPHKQLEKDVPSKQTEKDVAVEQMELDVPSKQTEKDVPCKQTEEDVTPKQMETDVPSKQMETDVPSKQMEMDVPSIQEEKDVPPEKTSTSQEKVEQTPPPQTERSTSSLGSAISSLIGGRNCTITTTIVTELTHVEPHRPDIQSNGQVNGTSGLSGSPVEEKKSEPATSPNSMQEYSPTVTEGLEESSVTIETPMLNLAKRVNHWVWDPNEERKRLESWQQEQERLLQEQYQREQEKLKKEWEKAQLEVEEEERKHNEEERRILEETVTPLNPTCPLNQTGTTSTAPENNKTEARNVPVQQNGQRSSPGNEDQHASKLHFFQDSASDGEPLKKQELLKTASLDRNPQLNQPHIVKRSESHEAVISKQQTSPSSPQPPSPSRCVSGKRLCSGCSQPLGKGAAMIIDTLGLFFHIQCFKCGVCKGQLGDATTGTDVRIRNGVLSCHECYIASRGRGQPTTL